jgi:hypothetical protein
VWSGGRYPYIWSNKFDLSEFKDLSPFALVSKSDLKFSLSQKSAHRKRTINTTDLVSLTFAPTIQRWCDRVHSSR